jgi:repressor of nif and glnA expression
MAILKALEEIGRPAGAARIRERLLASGGRLQPRTVRFYLLELDREGMTRS